MVKTLFGYPGGKTYLADWIIDHMPVHETYVEPFMGAATVFFNKPRASVPVLNDRDGDIVHFFKTLKERPHELIRWVKQTPYAKDLHEKYAKAFYDGYRPDDDIERAGRFFFLRYSQFSGKYNGFSGFRSSYIRNMSMQMVRAAQELTEFQKALRTATIENRDYAEIVERFDSNQSLVYLDPPYVQEGDNLYTGDTFDHERFVETVTGLESDVMISYTDLPEGLADWHVITQEASQHMRKSQDNMKKEARTERLVCNFDPSNVPKMRGREQAGLDDW